MLTVSFWIIKKSHFLIDSRKVEKGKADGNLIDCDTLE